MAFLAENERQNLTELVQRAARGEEAAFGQIYDLYFDKVYRFVYFRVNHQETAEDLTAETFIRVWNKLRGISDLAAFNGWVYQIARNLVIDYYRTRKSTLDLQELENVLEYEDNVVAMTDLGFEQKRFFEALQKLPSDQRLVVKFKFLDELDNGEIAKILDKSEGAVRVIQHRAIAALREILNNQQDERPGI